MDISQNSVGWALLNYHACRSAIYKSHLGERSSDLKRLPMASRRQCQTSVFAFEAVVPPLFLGSLLLACRRDDSVGTILALASCQCRFSTFLIVSGTAGGISAAVIAGGKLASVSTRALGSGSLSDFVNSSGTAAGSMLLSSAVGAATDVAIGPAVLIAIAAPRPTTQKRPNQIVLVIPNGKGSCGVE